MKNQRFGVEIEMTGITRATAAKVIAGHFHTTATHVGGSYDTYTVRGEDGRQWNLVRDQSIDRRNSRGYTDRHEYSVELVTPICKYDDITTIQEIVRKLRSAGAKVNDSCGIHVHVDASQHDVRTLRNLVNIMASKEDLLYKALDVEVERERYCKKVDMNFLEKLNKKKPKEMRDLEDIWYEGYGYNRHAHYNNSRYRALNLHSVFTKGTVEFRLFNSMLHAGEVKSYIQLCLAINNQALTQKSASRAKTQSANEKYTFRTWLLRLGLIGDEFKTARGHLLKKLEGNIAWKDPAQAEAQRERIAERRRLLEETENATQAEEQETVPEETQEAPALEMTM